MEVWIKWWTLIWLMKISKLKFKIKNHVVDANAVHVVDVKVVNVA